MIKTRNAILCDWANALKKKLYRLDIVVGKVCIWEHPLFSKEDFCAIELWELYEEYERVTSLRMIPFYQARIKALMLELRDFNRWKSKGQADDSEQIFLNQTLKEVKYKLWKEKKLIKELGGKIYRTWKELKQIRKDQGFKSTSVKLKVTEHELSPGKWELFFHLYHEAADTKKGTKRLPLGESRWRTNIKGLRAKVTILVNGFKVSSTFTKQAHINFPSFEVDIGENF